MEYPDRIIEDVFQEFKSIIAKDVEKYRNHVYRVFSNCLLLDNEKENQAKYAIAAVFHDIGIWTNHTFDYLDPSIEQAKCYLNKIGKSEWINEISLMIYWHHKVSRYKGPHQHIVENFRRADWIDVSLGLLDFGADNQKIKETRRQFPNAGFHVFLLKISLKNFFEHPLNPLPIFKK